MGKNKRTKREKEKINQILRARLSKRKRILLSLCDLLIVTVVLVDLMFFIDFLKISNLIALTIVNISVVILSYYSYKLRKRIVRNVIKESRTNP